MSPNKWIKKFKSHLVLTLAYTFLVVTLAIIDYKTKTVSKSIAITVNQLKFFGRKTASILTSSPEILSINILPKDFQVIKYHRDKALVLGILPSETTSFVPAIISFQNDEHAAEVRLKGVFPDHWRDENKMSLKVRLQDEDQILGMNQFSIMSPATRNFIYEWLFTQELSRHNIITPKVAFIQVKVNGKNTGIFTIEEDVGNAMLANSNRSDGPIIGFNKDSLIQEWTRLGSFDQIIASDSSEQFYTLPIDIVYSSKNLESTKKAATLLETFRAGEISVDQAFDSEKMATFLAIKAMFASSELDPNDSKFYFNPDSQKLEPIGSELSQADGVGDWWLNQGGERQSPFINLFLGDDKFFQIYLQKLSQFSSSDYLDQVFSLHQDEIDQNITILNREFPQIYLNAAKLYQNQQYIRHHLDPVKGIQAYVIGIKDSHLEMMLGNTQAFEVELDYLSLNDSQTFPFALQAKLFPKPFSRPVKYQPILVNLPANFSWSDKLIDNLKIHYQFVGIDKPRSDDLSNWPFTNQYPTNP